MWLLVHSISWEKFWNQPPVATAVAAIIVLAHPPAVGVRAAVAPQVQAVAVSVLGAAAVSDGVGVVGSEGLGKRRMKVAK